MLKNKFNELVVNEKLLVYIDGTCVYGGNQYLELVRALCFIYLDDFIGLILNTEIKGNLGKFVYKQREHEIKIEKKEQ